MKKYELKLYFTDGTILYKIGSGNSPHDAIHNTVGKITYFQNPVNTDIWYPVSQMIRVIAILIAED